MSDACGFCGHPLRPPAQSGPRMFWLPDIADPTAPTVAELDAGTEITGMVVQKYGTRRSFSLEEITAAEEQP